ncbi:MAG: adenylate/guanylate cyclase domain-containing protein, partial [Flavobacteriales bacterium]|nr:adenylate/guanylate cyclase domain-containing protein [Flavobacteriales bacterium]
NKKVVSRFYTDGQVFSEDVKAILFEPEGHIWIGSTQGVTRFEKTKTGFVFNEYHSNANINESEVSSIVQDDFGRLWISYLSAEIVIFEKGEFHIPELPQTLTDVSTIRQGPYGNMWFATEGSGLFKLPLTNENISEADFVRIGMEEGLSSSDLHQLVFDDQNNLWVGTASGIDKVELNNRAELKNVRHFGRTEGFIGTETNENAACLDTDGNLWFGTIRGVSRYNPDAERKNVVENQLHITHVQLEFEQPDWSVSELAEGTEGYFELPKNLILPYSLNGLEIAYNGINLYGSTHVRYQWKLEGYSNEWSMVESKKSHSFTNLAPKNYRFNVRSSNGNGIWNEHPATFSFTVAPPIWMTWWFIALSSLLLVLLIRGIIKLREKQLLAEKRKLQTKVDERTKELRHEKERSDELLLNILPHETAEELKLKGYASVRYYEKVSVLFTDFVGFTNITEGISHEELVNSLDEHFRIFDGIMDKYGVEKIKTIGDAYMAAGGIPTSDETNPLSVVMAGLEMTRQLKVLNEKKQLKGETIWELRLGIHTGSVISGVVGKNKFAFDIWGDAVNTAARMESSGEVMKVNVSGSTYEFIKPYFDCTARGKIKAKNKGEIEMYFVDRLKPEYCKNGDG